VLEDTPLADDKRWVLIAPPGARESSVVLAKAADADQAKWVGNQTGGRVAFFLFTDNLERDHEAFVLRGVQFVRPPQTLYYGTVAVFQDLYGNLWDLIEPSPANKGYTNRNHGYDTDPGTASEAGR
jgi:hypothetical protein